LPADSLWRGRREARGGCKYCIKHKQLAQVFAQEANRVTITPLNWGCGTFFFSRAESFHDHMREHFTHRSLTRRSKISPLSCTQSIGRLCQGPMSSQVCVVKFELGVSRRDCLISASLLLPRKGSGVIGRAVEAGGGRERRRISRPGQTALESGIARIMIARQAWPFSWSHCPQLVMDRQRRQTGQQGPRLAGNCVEKKRSRSPHRRTDRGAVRVWGLRIRDLLHE
jgi:hypothetical protein